MISKILEWDSSFFGLKIARVDSLSIFHKQHALELERLKKKGIDLVYFITNKDLNIPYEFLEAFNGILVDQKVTFAKEDLLSKPTNDFHIELNNQKLVSSNLLDLALLSGKHSRFKIDDNFPPNSFKRLYKEWIQKSLTGDLADFVLTYRCNDRILALATLKINANIGHVGLLAVSQDMQGKGIGRMLLQELESICAAHKVESLKIATQFANKKACRFYLINNYKILSEELVYHFWLNR
ncbi:MAG: GNAT family N-acetyltransferase [Desulfobacterales bacterium]|nr:GNAT family N-acetyltransferase [Desulfobacterales bacterium]